MRPAMGNANCMPDEIWEIQKIKYMILLHFISMPTPAPRYVECPHSLFLHHQSLAAYFLGKIL
jgi:hypothetical protein